MHIYIFIYILGGLLFINWLNAWEKTNMNIIEINNEAKELATVRKVTITFNMVQLMYCWTFDKKMPSNLSYVNAYREVLKYWGTKDNIVDLMIDNARICGGDFKKFQNETNKYAARFKRLVPFETA